MKILNNCLYCIVLFFLILFLMTTMTFKNINDEEVVIFGYQVKTILSDSMEENPQVDTSSYAINSLKTNELIVIKNIQSDYSGIKVGDVLTFKYVVGVSQKVITHRVIDVKEKEGGYLITLKGDNVIGDENVQIIDTTLDKTSYNYIIGKVVWNNYLLGIIITILKTKIGIVCTIITPSLFLVIYEIYKIILIIKENKTEKAKTQIKILEERIKELEGKCCDG